MAGENHGSVLRDLGRIFDGGTLVGLTDGQLLRRYAAGDEGAFDALVARCGPAVLGVCRRLLHNPGEVEDAFQDMTRPKGRRLRIETEGYMPEVSRVIRDDEDAPVINFVLRSSPSRGRRATPSAPAVAPNRSRS